jgi:hypothetical protein
MADDTSLYQVQYQLSTGGSRLVRICIQSLEKMLIRATNKIFLHKFNMGIKNAEFQVDFKSVGKVLNKFTKLLTKT